MPSPPTAQAAQQAIKFVAAALKVTPTAEELAVASTTNVGSTAAAIARRTSQAQQLLGGGSVGDQAEVRRAVAVRSRIDDLIHSSTQAAPPRATCAH